MESLSKVQYLKMTPISLCLLGVRSAPRYGQKGHFAAKYAILGHAMVIARLPQLPSALQITPPCITDLMNHPEKWEFHGSWRTEKDRNHHILIVTESGDGGIARPCRLWTDYVFEFETKIISHNTSWIIRAQDLFNYVMLQCQPTSLNPHFRVDGHWKSLDTIPLAQHLPMNTWFGVRITVTGTRVIATVRIDDTEREILNDRLLEPRNVTVQEKTVFASYPMGSMGFRESSKRECAHFRNVRVTRFG